MSFRKGSGSGWSVLLSGHFSRRECLRKYVGMVSMQDILSIAGIVIVLAIVVALFFYVKKQRDNHVQLFVYMYGSVLDGRLRNLIVNLEEFAEFLYKEDGQEKFSPDSLQNLGNSGLRETLFELLERNRLGNREKRNLQHGFDCLRQAAGLIHAVPAGASDAVRILTQEDRLKLQHLLTEAIRAFEAVRRRTVF